MGDNFGAIELPMAALDPFDPLLTNLLALVQAAVNADTADAWGNVVKAVPASLASPVPVAFVFDHNPRENAFTSKKLPAIYGWRSAYGARKRYTQDWWSRESTISLLWIPSLMNEALRTLIEPFSNPLDAALHKAIMRGKHPAWNAGATLRSVANYQDLVYGELRPEELAIQHTDTSPPDVYDGLLATLTVTEVLSDAGDTYQPISHIEGNVRINDPLLLINAFQFRPSVLSVTPSSGPAAGGTPITIAGHQYFEDDDVGELVVTIDGEECDDVVLVDGDTITATTPPGSAGAKDVVVTIPSGASSAPLVGGFTFT